MINAGGQATLLFGDMWQQGLLPVVTTYIALATCKQQRGLEPNVITYTAVISANGRTLQLFERCCSRDSCPIDHLHRSDQSQVSNLAAV